MNNDRELLELAAKAIGCTIRGKADEEYYNLHEADDTHSLWNPLTDDGDALRLAVKLEFTVSTWGEDVAIWQGDGDGRETLEPITTDRLASTRRAIVRAASEIGRAKP